MSGLLRRVTDLAVGQLSRATDPAVKELRAARLAAAIERNPLLRRGARHFSQNDEDGILLEILSRIGLFEPACFVEFGVGDGLENNTLILLAHGWHGAWIGGERLSLATNGSRVSFTLDWVTSDNAAQLAIGTLEQIGKRPSDARVVSIDLDGNDLYVAEALLQRGFFPDVLVVEYNAKFPPSAAFVIAYDATHKWAGDDYYGASLRSWDELLRDRYRLVACTMSGTNAFFVRKEHTERFDDVPHALSDLYNPGPFGLPYSGQKTSRRTVERFIR